MLVRTGFLWDGNLHFKKYCSELKSLNEKQKKQVSANLGYIAAYKIDKAEVDGCSVHTWLEFYMELKKLALLLLLLLFELRLQPYKPPSFFQFPYYF